MQRAGVGACCTLHPPSKESSQSRPFRETVLALGTTSGGTGTIDWTSASTSTSVSLSSLTLSEESTYYVSVRATDGAGNVSSVLTGDGIYIDLTNPVAGAVIDGATTDISYTPSSSTLTFTWSNFSDAESGIEYYNASIEDDDGNSVVAVTNVGTVTTWTVNNLSLVNAKTYEGVIQAVDYAGNVSTEVSSSVIVDTDGPVAGQVADRDLSLIHISEPTRPY